MTVKLTRALRAMLFACALCLPLAAFAGPATDSDSDGVPNVVDNCVDVANAGASGCDSDIDGYGNACDGDFDQNQITNATDFLTPFLADFTASPPAMGTNGDGNPDGTDMDCNGLVNATDFLNVFLGRFTRTPSEPGPSGLSCASNAPCL